MTTQQMDWLDDERAREAREAAARVTRAQFWKTFSRSNPRIVERLLAYRLQRTLGRFRGRL